MQIGYLHLGPERHGIRRYSEYLAAEAKSRQSLSIVEATVTPTADKATNQALLIDAARRLSTADVVHFQFSRSLLKGEDFRSLRQYVRCFRQNCSAPLVVTLHDIPLQYEVSEVGVKSVLQRLKVFLQHCFGRNGVLLWWIISQCQQTLVCNQEERRRLNSFASSYWLRRLKRIAIIPHFVEQRVITASRMDVRRALGLDKVKTITLLGWIFDSKGHDIAIEALAQLPEDVTLIFAGGSPADSQPFLDGLLKQAKEKGVHERIRVTGYLSDTEQEHYLIATDLAICPFKATSASGSISTWISIARPILASDLPQIHDYNQLQPGAIHTFQPYSSTALAEAINQLLLTCTEVEDQQVAQLRDQLQIADIFDQHLTYYQQVARRQTGHSSAVATTSVQKEIS